MQTRFKRFLLASLIAGSAIGTGLGGALATPVAAQGGTAPGAGSQTLVAQPSPTPHMQPYRNPMHFWCKPGGPAHNFTICNSYTYPHPDYR